MDYAEHEFRHASKLADGTEAGDHLESAQRQMAQLPGRKRPTPTGPIIPPGPPFPEALDYLWEWFQQITLGLPVSGMAPPVISWDSLQAWQELTRSGPLEPWEANALVQLGMMRAGIQAEMARSNRANSKSDPPPRIPPARIPNGR